MAFSSRCCFSVLSPGALGQSILATVATQTPRNSVFSIGLGAEGLVIIQAKAINGPINVHYLNTDMAQTIGFSDFDATAHNLVLEMGLVVSKLTLSLGNGVLKTSPVGLRLNEPGTLEAVVEQDAIAQYLEKLGPGGLSKFRVECRDGAIFVNAVARILLEVPVSAKFGLQIVNGKQLEVVLIEAQVVGGDANKLVESQLGRINPILDASDLPFPASFDEVVIENGTLTIHGHAETPEEFTA